MRFFRARVSEVEVGKGDVGKVMRLVMKSVWKMVCEVGLGVAEKHFLSCVLSFFHE